MAVSTGSFTNEASYRIRGLRRPSRGAAAASIFLFRPTPSAPWNTASCSEQRTPIPACFVDQGWWENAARRRVYVKDVAIGLLDLLGPTSRLRPASSCHPMRLAPAVLQSHRRTPQRGVHFGFPRACSERCYSLASTCVRRSA